MRMTHLKRSRFVMINRFNRSIDCLALQRQYIIHIYTSIQFIEFSHSARVLNYWLCVPVDHSDLIWPKAIFYVWICASHCAHPTNQQSSDSIKTKIEWKNDKNEYKKIQNKDQNSDHSNWEAWFSSFISNLCCCFFFHSCCFLNIINIYCSQNNIHIHILNGYSTFY